MRVFLDYAGATAVAAMRVGGMTVAERVVRDASRRGVTGVVVRAAEGLPDLSAVPVVIERIAESAPAPELPALDATTIAGVAISDEDSRRRAQRALLQSLRRPHDGLGDRYAIRPVSLRLTALLAAMRATPNQVTCLNILVGVGACIAAAGLHLIAAGALIILQVVLDSCDGELARLRHMSSKLGMWLDNVSDDLIDNAFVIALGAGLGGIWLWLGLAAGVSKGLCALMIHVDVARRGKAGDILSFQWFFDEANEDLAERFETTGSVLGTLRATGRRDFFLLAWGALCIASLPGVAILFGLAVGVTYFGLAVAHVFAVKARNA
jgi:hypothetical protein